MAHAQSRKEVNELLKTYRGEVEERHETEERRLAYVAFTRARSLLIASAYLWDDAVRPRVTSRFLTELRAELVQAEVDRWVEDPADGERNPRSGQVVSSSWPLDPLGARRSAVAAGAELVRSAFGDVSAAEAAALIEPALMPGLLDDPADRAAAWRRDVDLLLAERARLSHSAVIDVELPARLSVSDLVGLQRDPAGLARRLRRPLPSRPAPLARRGTAFHAWLEQRWSAQALLDVDDLPGAADSSADDSDLDALRQAFESSVWATRTPTEVEVGFDMSIDSVVVRGRMDAVFGDEATGWTVVDWKTGARPHGREADAAAVQLAAYRLAWARIKGVPDGELDTIAAAFHYVRSNETVSPANLMGAAQLRDLIAPVRSTASRT